MSIRKKLNEILRKALEQTAKKHKLELGSFVAPDVLARAIETAEHGDYASTLPFQLAKLWKKSPEEAGMILQEFLAVYASDLIKKIDSVKGFLNFSIADAVYQRELLEIVRQGGRYGAGAKQKISYSLDYLDANPTGPVHIGHARAGFLGDALARILKKAGHKVSREFYINNGKHSKQIQSLGATALGHGEEYKHDELLELIKKSEIAKKLKKIKGINPLLRRRSDNMKTAVFTLSSLAAIKSDAEAGFFIASLIQKQNAEFLKKIAGISYDVFFAEADVYKKKLHQKVLKALKAKKVTYEKGGAVWFSAKDFGDTEDRVLVRGNGEPTYILADIAYHLNRLADRKFTRVIDIFGADHHGYGPRLSGALQALGLDANRIHIITVQTVRLLKDGAEYKMSKRAGQFVTLEELIGEVGVDAARFFFLLHAPGTHMDFDLSLAKEKSAKNPVYYAQYSYARIASIMRRAGEQDFKKADVNLLADKYERALLRVLARFSEAIEDSARDFNVLRLTAYAIELARAFHHFYEQCRVVSDDKNLTNARLLLVEGTRIVLKNTFDCIGISAPEKM